MRRSLAMSVSVLASTAILMSSLAIPAMASPAPSVLGKRVTDGQCADVTFIAARGSGERMDEGQPKQSNDKKDFMRGFGSTIASMALSLEKQLPDDLSTAFIPVEYEALSVDEAMGVNSGYPRSVKTGIDAGTPLVKKSIASCPNSKFVLMGYSQGAHVMHEIIMRLDQNERDHVSSALLIADASRNPEDKLSSLTYIAQGGTQFAQTNASIYEGKGVMRRAAEADLLCRVMEASAKTRSSMLMVNPIQVPAACSALPKKVRFSDVMSLAGYPGDIANRILNVCQDEDGVCQTRLYDANQKLTNVSAIHDLTTILDLIQNFQHIQAIHGEGYKVDAAYTHPSNWALSMLYRSPNPLPAPTETATPTPTPTPTKPSPKPVSAPNFVTTEEWRTKAKKMEERGASGVSVYTNNADGAVVAFEDFFKLLAWEMSEFYDGREDVAATEAEKNKLIDDQLFRTMRFVDRESLGTEKVNDILMEYALGSAVLGAVKADIRVSRDNVVVADDGTVIITDRNVFFNNDGTITPVDAGGTFKLEYRDRAWVIVDVNVDGGLGE